MELVSEFIVFGHKEELGLLYVEFQMVCVHICFQGVNLLLLVSIVVQSDCSGVAIFHPEVKFHVGKN